MALEADHTIFGGIFAPLIVPEATDISVPFKRKYREPSSEDDDSPSSKDAKNPLPVAQNHFGL